MLQKLSQWDKMGRYMSTEKKTPFGVLHCSFPLHAPSLYYSLQRTQLTGRPLSAFNPRQQQLASKTAPWSFSPGTRDPCGLLWRITAALCDQRSAAETIVCDYQESSQETTRCLLWALGPAQQEPAAHLENVRAVLWETAAEV